MKKLPKLIAILGPTASGKTDLAVVLAKKFGGEIVNADSRTIYKGMNIGTAKPKIVRGFYRGIRHRLFDIVNPDKGFSAADFKEAALAIINDIILRGKVPFLVGGTGFYIDAITKNLTLGEAVSPNKKLRRQFERDLRINRAGALKKYYQKLLKLDPKIKIDKNNPRRIIRALEICLTGKKFSEQQKEGAPLFKILEIGVGAPRAELYRRIGGRVDKMMKLGLGREVRKLSKKYNWSSPGMSGIGYREWRGKSDKSEIAEQIKKNTRNYAKRQLTWFRRDKKIRWISNQNQAQKIIKQFLTR